jgi:hypothetical protein
MFKILTRWFELFKGRNLKIPPNFDIHILINVMVILFNSYHALGITAALNFWYSFSDLFPVDINIYFLKIVIKYFFFKIFLHWSSNVRDAFTYIICYKVLYYFEKNEEHTELNKILLRINRRLNLIEKAVDRYSLERFKWDIKSKLERRKHTLDELKKSIIESILSLPTDQLSVNYFSESDRFGRLMSRPLSRNHHQNLKSQRLGEEDVFLAENKFDQSLLSIKESRKSEKMVTVRDYRVKLTSGKQKTHEYMLKPKSLAYCGLAISNFKTKLDEFYLVFNNEGDISADKRPVLSLKLPIDEFEFMDSDEQEW